ncbi:MAG: class II aldolase and adducin N-terminal domain-containing protein [Arcobacteraceae bacterium]|nr:class II aldolase and adducin N-terminal domain-containing protein [Arcobacteraceae bacterium]
MIDKKTVDLLSNISLALFRKNFFGIYHGSISSKVEHNKFIINTKEAIFDEISKSSLCQLKMNNYDYSWKLASLEADIHNSIYNQIHEAKYIACGMPPYTTAYALEHDTIEFEDYFGKTLFGKIEVYDAGDFNSWYDRNQLEITKFLKQSSNHVMVIRGVGVYVYDRDINELIKKVAILENSCRLLGIKSNFD